MRRGLYLGFDVGTQGTKALVIDTHAGAIVARASSSYGLIEGLAPGHAEQHPDTWWRALRETTAALGERCDLRQVAGLAVSGQQHGCVVLDAAGEVIRPAKLWCDTSTALEARELSNALGREIPAGFTASKLVWLKRHEPLHWARVELVLLPHDWVNYKLTGLATMEPGDASGTGWFETRERRFSARALAAIDARMPSLLPPLIESGSVAGELTADGARWIGLPRECVGALVATGGGDNMMSAIGSGATREGLAVVSLGTSATVFAHAPRPIDDPSGSIAPFCDSSGGWLPLVCLMNATGVLEEVRAAFGGTLDDLTRAAREVERGAQGVTFVPFLMGERVPNLPQASGTLLGLRPGTLRAGHVFRAALEGVALNLAGGVNRMRELGLAVDDVRLVGGGARNVLWRSILAEALAARVSVLAETESGALGAALQAAWTVARVRGARLALHDFAAPWVKLEGAAIEPSSEGTARYADLRRAFAEHVRRLHG